MSQQQEQLFPTHEIEIHQVVRDLGETANKFPDKHLITVEHDSHDLLVLHENPVGGINRYTTSNNLGDVIEVEEKVIEHSGISIPFRPNEGLIARRQGAEWFTNSIKGFLLDCIGYEPGYLYVTSDFGDIVRNTALIPLQDVKTIELRPVAERDYLARYQYGTEIQQYTTVPILEKDGVVIARREFTHKDSDRIRKELEALEGEIIYERR